MGVDAQRTFDDQDERYFGSETMETRANLGGAQAKDDQAIKTGKMLSSNLQLSETRSGNVSSSRRNIRRGGRQVQRFRFYLDACRWTIAGTYMVSILLWGRGLGARSRNMTQLRDLGCRFAINQDPWRYTDSAA
jgi:hypothetical protein